MNCPACGSALRPVDGLCPTCVARTMTTLLVPRAIAEDAPDIPGYALGEIIGRGGMGVVFRATRVTDGAALAIKLMPAEFSDRDDLAERFAREVDTLTALDHPHILRVLDSGLTADGRWFLVAELAEGGDLARRLRSGPLPVDEALRIFREVAAAIGEAHRRGIAHRDIKPANVLLTADGSVRVGDFSLAKLLDAAPDLTRSAEVFGTPYYIAPEVRRGAAHVDERADIFSLGVLLHEMLTGRLPIGEYEPAPRFAPLIARCLREDPARRPASVDELLAGLDRAPRTRVWALSAALVLALAAVAFQHLKPPTPSPASPITAAAQRPWQNSLGMKFVPVPGTRVLFSVWETRRRDFETFAQNDDRPNLGPNRQWRAATASPDEPVHPVSMLLASEFCEWLTRTEHTAGTLPQQMSYRLPADDEWSRAAQLPPETGATPEERHCGFGDEGHAPYIWGRTWLPPAREIDANFAGQEYPLAPGLRHRDAFPGSAPAGSFKPNALGIHDLAGNVAEWCATPWNPRSTQRVLRGGAWFHSRPGDLRLDARQAASPTTAPQGAGFRIVLDPGTTR